MDKKLEHPQLILHPLVLLAIAILLTWLLGWLVPLPFVGGLLFGFPAFRLMLIARTTLNPLRPSTALIEGGTYRITRNPMYLGMLIAYAGLFIYLQNAWFIPGVPLLIWLLTIGVIVPEEHYLQHRFGEAYAQFASRVPRW